MESGGVAHAPGAGTRAPSIVSQRCDRIRETVTLRQLFDQLGWDAPDRGRIHCVWPDHEDRSPAMQPYWDTNSVYCFACTKGGGVIEITRETGGGSGKSWSLDQALDWLEREFGLPPLTPTESLRTRLKKVLTHPGQGAAPGSAGSALSQWSVARDSVRTAFDQAERGVPHNVVILLDDQRDYIWAEAEGFSVDPLVWASWARTMIFGSYANRLSALRDHLSASLVDPPAPPEILYDDEATCDSYWLWDTHLETGMLDERWPVCTTMFLSGS